MGLIRRKLENLQFSNHSLSFLTIFLNHIPNLRVSLTRSRKGLGKATDIAFLFHFSSTTCTSNYYFLLHSFFTLTIPDGDVYSFRRPV